MDRIETEKTYPQKVEVINDINAVVESSPDNPVNIVLPAGLIISAGGLDRLRVNVANINEFAITKPNTNTYNVCFGSCVASNQGASVVVPLNICYYNLSGSKLEDLILELETNLPLLFPAGSTIRFTYSTLDSQSTPRFYVVSVQ